MISGYLKTGLGTLSGFHDGKTYPMLSTARADMVALTSFLQNQISYLSTDAGNASIVQKKKNELSNALSVLDHWPANASPVSADALMAMQWRWGVDAIDAVDIRDKLFVRRLLMDMMSFNQSVTYQLISGEIHWLNAWESVIGSYWRWKGTGELSDLANYEILTSFLDTRKTDNIVHPSSRPPPNLSGIAPYDELAPWLNNAGSSYPAAIAQQVSQLNSSAGQWNYDLGTSTSVRSVVVPCWETENDVPDRIRFKTVQLSTESLSADHPLTYTVNSLEQGQTVWANKDVWNTVRPLSSRTSFGVLIGQTKYGTSDLPDLTDGYPTFNPRTQYATNDIEAAFAPNNFLPFGQKNIKPMENQLADLKGGAYAAVNKTPTGQDVYGMHYSLNDCAVLCQLTPMPTPGNLCSETTVWTSTGSENVYPRGYDPLATTDLPRPYLGYSIGQYTYLDMKVKYWRDESNPTQIDWTRSYCNGTPLIRDVSAAVWHKSLSGIVDQPVPMFAVPIFLAGMSYKTWTDARLPGSESSRVWFNDGGLINRMFLFAVSGDRFWGRKSGQTIVEDPDGDILCVRAGDNYKIGLENAITQVRQFLPQSIPDPMDPDRPVPDVTYDCLGITAVYINVFGPCFSFIWYPWKNRYELMDLKKPQYIGPLYR